MTPWDEIYSFDDIDDQPEMLKRLIRFRKLCDLGEYRIRTEDAALLPLDLNLAQQIVLAACMRQAAAGRPIRVTILKSRKVGISTEIETLFAYLGAYYRNQIFKLVAHREKSTEAIFGIAALAASKHVQRPCDPRGGKVAWTDMDSLYVAETAGGVAVGAGETPNGVHLSEVAKWEKNKGETWYNIMNAVPKTPTSCVFVESTAKGREQFFAHWEANRAPGSEYEAIFIPWYFDERCVAPVAEKLVTDDEEKALMQRAAADGIELSAEMLQWRREKIIEIGADAFRQEYPSTPAEAVQGTAGLILPLLRDCIVDGCPSGTPNVGGIDFGFSDPTVIWSGVEQGGRLWLTHYYRAEGGLAEDHVEGLVPGCTYYCDPTGLTDRKQLAVSAAQAGVRVSLFAAPRHKKPGEDIAATEMKKLTRFVETGRLCILREVADQLILEADNLAWNEKTGRINDARSPECGHYDSIYALKYLVCGLDCAAPSIQFADTRSTPSRAQRLRAL